MYFRKIKSLAVHYIAFGNDRFGEFDEPPRR